MNLEQAKDRGIKVRALDWTDPAPPTKDVSFYDHVITETPFGRVTLEWKSWKDYDDPCGMMPWDEFVRGNTLDEAKAAVQSALEARILAALE